MLSVAVICAYNVGNAGMVTVDAAAEAYFAARPCRFTLFMVAPASFDADFAARGITRLADPAQLADFDVVVFWGDFQNNPHYGRGDFMRRVLRQRMVGSEEAALRLWRRIFLLQGLPGDRPRAISVGGNFQHCLISDPDIQDDMIRLTERFELIVPRDPVSLLNVARFYDVTQLHRLRPGIDCAFLQPPMARETAAAPTFAHAFGRSRLAAPERLVAAAAEASGCAPVALDWLGVPPVGGKEAVDAMLRQIAGARFVLTDYYHCAINALCLEVPVILLARPNPRQQGTIGDFKKRVLADMLEIEDWLVALPREGEGPRVEARIAALAARMAQGVPITARLAPMRHARDRMLRTLDRALFPAWKGRAGLGAARAHSA